MKNLPLGVQTFRDFIEQDYLYVDKTKQIHDLFARGGRYYFLSRPRRFGKSVLVSTLKEIFSGNKKLFKDLWIYDKIEWTEHPVIHMDFSKIDFETPADLKKTLKDFLIKTATSYGLSLDNGKSYKQSFIELIEKCATKGRVVILIDEYDKPMIQYVESGDNTKAKKIREVLKNFYSVIKASDAFLQFVFITGVSKFAKVSIFSDLNNLTDITFHPNYSTLLGYTHAELDSYFSQHIEQMAQTRGQSIDNLKVVIRNWYNGYSWDGKNFVYNPFSIVNLFYAGDFANFWFTTGTPTFLIKTIKKEQNDIVSFENLIVNSFVFDSYDIDNIETPVLLLQTGYLTVKKITIKNERKTYHLSYPNKEVQDSFLTHLFDAFTKKKMTISTQLLNRLSETVHSDDIESFFKELSALFASIPHQVFIKEREAYYHTVIYLVLTLSGAVVRCEESTNTGCIDAVLETEKKIYIMEFKMGTAQEAMKQIKAKKYYEKYLEKGKEINLLGVGFDAQERNIGSYKLETINK